MICTHCAEARENCYYFEIEYQSYFFSSSFSLLSFVPDCIPWAESFPYENHHSQARTSLQVARGKNEAFFLTFFLFSRWWSFATFAKKQVTGWPDRFFDKLLIPNFSFDKKVLWPTKWRKVTVFYLLFWGWRFRDNNKTCPAHYSSDFILFTQSIFGWWKSIIKFWPRREVLAIIQILNLCVEYSQIEWLKLYTYNTMFASNLYFCC